MNVIFYHQCKKDIQHWKEAGWNIKPFTDFLRDCVNWPLPSKYNAHELTGDRKGIWDIHIRHNWLVLLRKEKDTITLLRTGTHAYVGIK